MEFSYQFRMVFHRTIVGLVVEEEKLLIESFVITLSGCFGGIQGSVLSFFSIVSRRIFIFFFFFFFFFFRVRGVSLQ
jgi:hypothetical protein